MKVIGLTGNIASGKSYISEVLKKLGAYIIDMDKVAKEVQERNCCSVLEKIRETFSSEVFNPDGTLNRKALGNKVFRDKNLLLKLNEIMVPVLTDILIEEIKKAKQLNVKAVIVDAAILFEANWDKLVDEVWVVFVPKELQKNRLMEREHITEQEALARIESQMPIEEKMKKADVVIDNSKDKETLERKVIELWKERVIST